MRLTAATYCSNVLPLRPTQETALRPMPDVVNARGVGEPRVGPFRGSDEEWDAAVREIPGGTFCHLSGWRHVLSDVLGHEFVPFVATGSTGDIEGLLPLAHVRSRIFGDYLLSMPFLSYGGPIGASGTIEPLVRASIEEAGRRGVDLLELRCRTRVEGSWDVSERKLTVLKSLPDSSEELWDKGLRAKVRSQIRRPMKEGMTVAFGTGSIDSFYEVFARTMRDLGTPVLPKAFFTALVERFPEELVVAVVEHQGRAVAAGCGFCFADEVEITWAGALRDYSRLAPNMLLYWGFMEEAVRRRAGVFNFGRCSPDSGTHRFKRQWGGDDHTLPWVQWSPSGVVATPSPDGTVMRLATQAWSRLPLGVANALGPRISRSLP